MALCRKDSECLILMIHEGKNTFKDIREAFPDMGRNTLYNIIGDDFITPGGIDYRRAVGRNSKNILLYFEDCPADYHSGYSFKDSNTFTLSETGEDILYQLEKERRNNGIIYITAIASVIAAITGILALIH